MTGSVAIRRRELPDIEALHAAPVAHRVLAARGIRSRDELDFSLTSLPPPDGLPDIDLAVQRLLSARDAAQRVLIVGDYDCDGATSTALAVLGLRAFGFKHVDYLVPNRFSDGYGLSPSIVERAVAGDKPDLIVTVDNGIASVDGVARASAAGVDVVVTDHHLPPMVLPDAFALVNPTRVDATFPSRNLAGVGVTFYLLVALRAELARRGDAKASVKLAQWLDLVAIGTVADVVPLDRVNRVLVEQGLRRIRAGRTRPGILALLQKAGRDPGQLVSSDIGFALGPRLNAAGRLDDMGEGIECLLSGDAAAAGARAERLDQLNIERRRVEATMRSDAEACLEQRREDQHMDAATFGVTLFDPEWHQGVTGIVAGRLKDRLHRPVVVFTSSDGDRATGSARSIPGVHVRDVLAGIDTALPGMLEKFGGHAMAAGMTIPRARLDEFSRAFDEGVRTALGERLPTREWLSDGELTQADHTLACARMLRTLMPWGQGFEVPLFDGVFDVREARRVGSGHLKLGLSLAACNEHGRAETFDAIAFNESREVVTGSRLRIVYALDVHHWRDVESLQLMIRHIETV